MKVKSILYIVSALVRLLKSKQYENNCIIRQIKLTSSMIETFVPHNLPKYSFIIQVFWTTWIHIFYSDLDCITKHIWRLIIDSDECDLCLNSWIIVKIDRYLVSGIINLYKLSQSFIYKNCIIQQKQDNCKVQFTETLKLVRRLTFDLLIKTTYIGFQAAIYNITCIKITSLIGSISLTIDSERLKDRLTGVFCVQNNPKWNQRLCFHTFCTRKKGMNLSNTRWDNIHTWYDNDSMINAPNRTKCMLRMYKQYTSCEVTNCLHGDHRAH